MKFLKQTLFLLVLIDSAVSYAAGDPRQCTIDSLQTLLYHAKHDTDKVKLKYQVGEANMVSRVSFWDSIASEAARLHMPAMEYDAMRHASNLCLDWKGDWAKGCEYIKRSLSVAEASGDNQRTIIALKALAQFYFFTSNYKLSMDYCFRGLKIAEEMYDTAAIAALNMKLAYIYKSSGELNKALALHLNCLELYKKLNNALETAGCLLDIGTIYKEQGNQGKAVAYYLETEKYVDDLGESSAAAEIYNAIGGAYRMQQQFDQADVYYVKSLQMAERINCQSCVAGCLAAMAENSYLKNNIKTAEQQALKSLEISKDIRFKPQVPILEELLTRIYEKEGRYKEALETYKLYTITRDSVSNENNRKAAMEKQFAHDYEKKENENQLLAQQNQIQLLKLRQDSWLIAGLTGMVMLIITVAWLLVRQNKIQAVQQNIQLEQKLLRSQMNPHFIFNSLQAIQHFVLKQDIKEAVKYLSSFSFITRTVLESSRTELISLKKERVLLESYLQLQKLRFGDRFEYTVIVNDLIDAEHVLIPPMLAQPFAENAIEHGMTEITSGGMVNVQYSIKGNFLEIEITDNGWGLKHGNIRGKQHKSMAMEITRERIALMNKKKNLKASLRISEAFPSNNDRKGVQVNIRLPLDLGHLT